MQSRHSSCRYSALVLLFLVAHVGQACSNRSTAAEFAPRTLTFLNTLATRDTSAVLALSADTGSMLRAQAFKNREPEALRAAIQTLRPLSGSNAMQDSARLFYTIQVRGTRETLAIGFVRRDTTWLVYWVGLPDRQ